MLRSPKSTQRKIRQLELIIAADAADDTELAGTSGLGGPASNQVKSNSNHVFSIALIILKICIVNNNFKKICPQDNISVFSLALL